MKNENEALRSSLEKEVSILKAKKHSLQAKLQQEDSKSTNLEFSLQQLQADNVAIREDNLAIKQQMGDLQALIQQLLTATSPADSPVTPVKIVERLSGQPRNLATQARKLTYETKHKTSQDSESDIQQKNTRKKQDTKSTPTKPHRLPPQYKTNPSWQPVLDTFYPPKIGTPTDPPDLPLTQQE